MQQDDHTTLHARMKRACEDMYEDHCVAEIMELQVNETVSQDQPSSGDYSAAAASIQYESSM